MKGLVEATASSAVFLVIKHGTLCQERKNPTDGFEAIEVTNKTTGELITKYIKRYKEVEGMITKIEWRDTGDKYAQQYTSWKIHMDAAGVPTVLEIGFDSRVATRFMKVAENIDYSKPVEISAWLDTKNDPPATAVNFKQDGKNIPQKYTQENPGDCPPPIQKTVGGKKKWDFDDEKEFLYQRMMKFVIPTVEAVRANGTHVEEPDPFSDDGESRDLTEEDIPF